MSDFAWWAVVGFNVIVLCYTVFILIAVWRSAEKYKGNRSWTRLVRFLVIMGVLNLTISCINIVKEWNEVISQSDIILLNKSLPTMLDKETRWDYVFLKDGDLYGKYTLVNYLVEDLDIAIYKAAMTSQTTASVCSNEELREFIDNDKSIIYTYYDKNKSPITYIATSLIE